MDGTKYGSLQIKMNSCKKQKQQNDTAKQTDTSNDLYKKLRSSGTVTPSVSVTFVRKIITTVVLLGSSLFLFILSSLDNYYGSLVCMAFALACLGFHCSGVLLNPQDMAPNHGGQLYGIMATVGTFPGFAGVYMVGYLLETTNQWSVIFTLTGVISIFGWIGYILYGSSEVLL
ncbi:unnamed protein product [Heterobilharzia americana]|nr:unnamed protein product [Heterobilharzia americana]